MQRGLGIEGAGIDKKKKAGPQPEEDENGAVIFIREGKWSGHRGPILITRYKITQEPTS